MRIALSSSGFSRRLVLFSFGPSLVSQLRAKNELEGLILSQHKRQLFTTFHLNLAFSSIEEDQHEKVIAACYWPLLNLVDDSAIKLGLELTGWTLERIAELDPKFIDELKNKIRSGQCEVVGSGYSQLIGPLVPAKVNKWNLALGTSSYLKILGTKPKIALINEMAVSSGILDNYLESGYEAVVFDVSNTMHALENYELNEIPQRAVAASGKIIPVLWAECTLFQKLQRYIHGEISESDYFQYFIKFLEACDFPIPIYTSDAEVFDFRPGRFQTEASRSEDFSEWLKMKKLFITAASRFDLQWCLPSEALNQQLKAELRTGPISSGAVPVPVKKQAKYNISRWAVSGRDDLFLNSTCHRFAERMGDNPAEQDQRVLCSLFASDLRTHITEKKWQAALKWIHVLQDRLTAAPSQNAEQLILLSQAKNMEVFSTDTEKKYLSVKTAGSHAQLNLKKGLTFKNIGFREHNYLNLLGTVPQGEFWSVDKAADFFSGGIIVEIPQDRKRITDLNSVDYKICENAERYEISCVAVNSPEIGIVEKKISFAKTKSEVKVTYFFQNKKRPVGIVRVGHFTFLPISQKDFFSVECKNGGDTVESFSLLSDFDHKRAVSALVSANSGLGCTDGKLRIFLHSSNGSKLGIEFFWQPSAAAVFPMLRHETLEGKKFLRVAFSLVELDDTLKPGGQLLDVNIGLRPL